MCNTEAVYLYIGSKICLLMLFHQNHPSIVSLPLCVDKNIAEIIAIVIFRLRKWHDLLYVFITALFYSLIIDLIVIVLIDLAINLERFE